jgi:tartrate dehydrogenase/decarboxylase / D-malate dehydrogenase
MGRSYNIAVIAGDGIGMEVMPEGVKAVQSAMDLLDDFEVHFEEFDWGTEYYLKTGRMMPVDGLKILEKFDAIYLGAVGMPNLAPDHITLWGLLLEIRKSFEQNVNIRPVRLLPGVRTPLRDRKPGDIDFICIRENTEGEYAGAGGRLHVGTPYEVALQTGIFTRYGTERVMRYAFELARSRPRKKLTSVTKSNAWQYGMVFWDETFTDIHKDYPDVQVEKWHVDAMAARFITNPDTLDVVVASNLFGDILTDLGGAIHGGLGISTSGNLNPERRYPSMFEPVHGSAPDIYGQRIANPVAMIWAGAMMLDFLGEKTAHDLIMEGIGKTLESGVNLTRDMGGNAHTDEMGSEIAHNILNSKR